MCLTPLPFDPFAVCLCRLSDPFAVVDPFAVAFAVPLPLLPPLTPLPCCGSGMFILNPPWTLHDELKVVMPYLVKVLGQDDGAGFELEHRENNHPD